MRQEVQITKLRCTNEMENYFLLFAALMEEVHVCAKETWVSISTLFTF